MLAQLLKAQRVKGVCEAILAELSASQAFADGITPVEIGVQLIPYGHALRQGNAQPLAALLDTLSPRIRPLLASLTAEELAATVAMFWQSQGKKETEKFLASLAAAPGTASIMPADETASDIEPPDQAGGRGHRSRRRVQ